MKRLFSILVLLIFMAFGVAIAIVNAEPVQFNFYYGSMTQPLSILLVGAIMIGALLATIINSMVIFSLRHQVRRAQRQLKKVDEKSVTVLQAPEKHI
ncbi:LapA family protein [sulfur-oxidizing endosymbiont of Gigantopelta aegis]|uniref:LapA family protein n=1 Tax=sulfur-oxidizing endosymbiont of Gigantopelta aegis TaxID=2794934 RepID=UPI0018DE356A|nr:LapA family protein [sulfur-oxidizing endosymbiont of Gigantopelta aegis]